MLTEADEARKTIATLRKEVAALKAMHGHEDDDGEWRKRLVVGSFVDAQDFIHKWCEGVVTAVVVRTKSNKEDLRESLIST